MDQEAILTFKSYYLKNAFPEKINVKDVEGSYIDLNNDIANIGKRIAIAANAIINILNFLFSLKNTKRLLIILITIHIEVLLY